MKKIFTLLALVMFAVCASAQKYYKGNWHSNPGNFADYEGTVAVTTDANGNYTFVFDRVVLGDDDLGQLTFAGVPSSLYAGNNGITFSQSGGSVTMAGTYFELTGTSIDDEAIELKFNYFEYNGLSYRIVKFIGTRTSSGTTDPSTPQITSTEQFTADVHSTLDGTMLEEPVVYPNVNAQLCEWSDGSYSIELSNIDTEKGTFQNVVLKGLSKTEGADETYYNGVVTPECGVKPSFYDHYTNLTANVSAVVDEDGELHATVVFTDESEPSFKLTVSFNPEDIDEPADPVVLNGTLSGYTKNDDGEFTNNASSTLTFTETADDVYKVTLTNVALPYGAINLGTVTVEGVACDANESTLVATFTKKGGECTTEAEHPSYTSVDLISFDATAQVAIEDDEEEVKSCTAKLVIDNYDETVTYTFNFDPTATSVKTVVAEDGTVKRIFTLSGASVNTLQRGVNIVRTADGRTVKVLKK